VQGPERKEEMKNEHGERKYFTPVPQQIYENAGGGFYACIASFADCSAVMINLKSGWRIMCRGVGMYDDGLIDWNYSTGGQFVEIPYQFKGVRA
jgi:hypothetical protein